MKRIGPACPSALRSGGSAPRTAVRRAARASAPRGRRRGFPGCAAVRTGLRLVRSTCGAAAVEMALVAPVLLVLLFGTLDVGWRLLAEYRLSQTAASLADLVARARDLRPNDLENAFAALPSIAAPFDLRTDGTAIVSGIEADAAGRALVVWQRRSPWGLPLGSVLGAPGASVPRELVVLQPREAVVAGEVVLRFRPLVGLVLPGERTIRRVWFAAPRYGVLDDPSS